ncbi:MAG: transglycosylase domain-containing protein, partial [Candidatus Binatia bacterium]
MELRDRESRAAGQEPRRQQRWIPYARISSNLTRAVLVTEDSAFWDHDGVDYEQVKESIGLNFDRMEFVRGGSTITQQLAKNLFLTPERGWVRKANEAVLALMLELHLSKEEILDLYLNNVYLGRSGSIGIYGISQAARAFFGKSPPDLTIGEAATIAGVIQAPNAYSPLRHADRARARRDEVLALMAGNRWIGERELAAVRREPLKIRRGLPLPLEAPFFVDEVLRRIRRMGYDPETVRGLSVYTTADLELQHLAEGTLAQKLEALEKQVARLRRADAPLQGAVVVIDSGTGFVRAMAGGRDFTRSQFNRVTRSRRQPGSAFKPFVYLAALDDPEQTVTPSTLLPDEPLRLRVGARDWQPTNYDGRYLGDLTVRAAIEGSRNVPTVALARRVGLERIASLARLAGLRSEPVVPAMALGSAEVTLLNLAAAYTVFPILGEVVRPALIRGVMTADGQVLYRDTVRRMRIATAPAAYVTSHLLEGVINSGTGAAVRRLGLTQPLAGKTGTTNDEKDAWFVGYSPEWVAGVWVGFDDGKPFGMTGSGAALPIWAGVMRDVLAATEERFFTIPPGVVFRDVDRYSGLLATWSCPESV